MQSILIATTNKAKRDESIRYLSLPHIYKSLTDFPDIQEFEEKGNTLLENAIAKAKYYATQSQLPTFASDGGFCIDALNGAPGVHSRRWSGAWTSDEELICMVIEKLKGVPREKRTARMAGAFVFAIPNGAYTTAEQAVEGYVAASVGPYPPGFPYRGLLLVEPFKKYYSELTTKEHDQINHWRAALEQLRPRILQLLSTVQLTQP